MSTYVIGEPHWSAGDKQVFSSRSGFPLATYGQNYVFPTVTVIPLDVTTGQVTANADQSSLETIFNNLSSLMKLKVVSDIPSLLIYFIPENSFSETFTNNLQESFLAEFQPMGAKIGQTLQMLGVNPSTLQGEMSSLLQSVPGVGETASSLTKSLIPFMTGLPYQWPKIWTGSSAPLSYTVKTQLQCTSPNDDDDYLKNIVDPIFQLLRYVLPRSIGNGFYQWPYFCQVTAPGLFNLPKAMISNLVIERGPGGVFTMQTPRHKYNRPAFVNVEITFTSLYDFVGQQGSKGQKPDQGIVDYISGILGTSVPADMTKPTARTTIESPTGTVQNPNSTNPPGKKPTDDDKSKAKKLSGDSGE